MNMWWENNDIYKSFFSYRLGYNNICVYEIVSVYIYIYTNIYTYQ